jgi:speckle-type POZ protein
MPKNESRDKIVHQWVKNIIAFSSQYNSNSWSANKVIGAPQVYPNYGDLTGTWAQGTCSSNEWIELEFEQELFVTRLNIYETYHAGAIRRIKLKNRDEWVTVWQVERVQNIVNSRIFSPELQKTKFKTNKVRLELDCTIAGTWCEIDAVEMEGKLHDIEKFELGLASDLKTLLINKQFCDVQFEIEGKIADAHRNILAARSDYFKSILCENLKSNRLAKPIHISNISYDSFQSMLFYLYTNQIEENTRPEIVCELMRASEWFNLDDLKKVGYNYLSECISIDNVIEIYKSSNLMEPRLESLNDLALKYMRRNFSVIVPKKEFKELPQELLLKLTQFFAKN